MTPRSMVLALSWGTLSITPLPSNMLPPQLLPVYGGSGGTAFSRDCGSGKVLTGLRYRDGLFVDALGLLCRPVSSSGALGPESTVGTLVGGGGGSSGSVSCASGTVVTTALIYHGSLVSGVLLYCRVWDAASRKFVGSSQSVNDRVGSAGGTATQEGCEAPTQPASGFRGRAGLVLDAVGFVCDEP